MPKDKAIFPSSLTLSPQDEMRDAQPADITNIAQVNAAMTAQSPAEVANYIAEMLESLEKLSQDNHLSILALMLAMARDQADDDAGELRTDHARAAR